MKNIHIIPTDKPSRLHFTEFEEELMFTPQYEKLDGVNIYITSDEEIKESFRGWFIGQGGFYKKCVDTKIINNELYLLDYLGNTDRLIWCKKIILTTDQDLIKDGVQAIDDEFLEWFVKNPSCQKILIGIEIWNDGGFSYRIIIPKEEPKGFIPDGNWNHEEEVQVSDYNKQETIHGVAHRLFSTMPSEISTSTAKSKALELAKWQQEQEKNKYSEEEMLKMLHKFGFDYTYNYKGEKTIYEWIPEWFEEYKRLNN